MEGWNTVRPADLYPIMTEVVGSLWERTPQSRNILSKIMKQYKIKERKSTATHLKEVIEPLHKVKRTMKAEEYINYIPIMFSQLFKQAYRCAKLENNEGDVELIEGLAQKHGIPITQGTGFADYPSEYSWYL